MSSRFILLAIAASSAFALAAVQVVPSAEFSRQSGRAATSVARSVWELPRHAAGDSEDRHWADGLLGRNVDPRSHQDHAFHFSLGPWRLAELVWPNVSGRQMPVHRRWLEVIPAEGRVWVPSLYMGIVPLLLALATMRLGRAEPRVSWLSWMTLLALVACFGWYGLGWLIDEGRLALGAKPDEPGPIGAAVGGLYWLFTILLPGYIYFRYPAKLLVIVALGLSMLAARGWDRAFDDPSLRLKRLTSIVTAASLVGVIVTLAVGPFWNGWLSGVEPDILFGPLDAGGAYRDLLSAFVQTAVLGGIFLGLLRLAGRNARWVPRIALILLVVDLALANAWMVICSPAEDWEKTPALAQVLAAEESKRDADQPYRVYRQPIWMRPDWSSESSPDRLADAMRWDRDTLWPKYHLGPGIPVAEVNGTMKPYDYQVFLWTARKNLPQRENTGASIATDIDAVGAKYVILDAKRTLPHGSRIPLDGTAAAGLEDVSLWYNERHLPRAWIVHDVDVQRPVPSHDPRAVLRQTESVFRCQGHPRDFRRSAVVEVADDVQLESSRSATLPSDESCRVVSYEPDRVEIEAELIEPGLVVLADQFYPGWQLEVETAGQPGRRMPILRTNRVMRGAWLTPGSHRLVYHYRPASFARGASISLIAWIVLALTGVITFTKKIKSRTNPPRAAQG